MLDDLKRRVDALRPLTPEYVAKLLPMWRNDDILHVYASNAIEGSTMTLAETRVVLEDGITIGGKSLREHLEIVNGQRAYALMLSLAQNQIPITTAVLRSLHRAVVGETDFAGQWRDHPVYIRGSRHVPPNYETVNERLEKAFVEFSEGRRTDSPIVAAAQLHFAVTHIHPFADGNGRTARLFGNLWLIRNGFPPILIEPEQRAEYFAVLERCSLRLDGNGDPAEFIGYIADQSRRALTRYLRALETSEGLPFDVGARATGLVITKELSDT